MPVAKLSSKSQIVVPAPMRRQLGLEPGDLLEISLKEDEIVLRKAPRSFVDALAACASEDFREYDQELDKARNAWG